MVIVKSRNLCYNIGVNILGNQKVYQYLEVSIPPRKFKEEKKMTKKISTTEQLAGNVKERVQKVQRGLANSLWQDLLNSISVVIRKLTDEELVKTSLISIYYELGEDGKIYRSNIASVDAKDDFLYETSSHYLGKKEEIVPAMKLLKEMASKDKYLGVLEFSIENLEQTNSKIPINFFIDEVIEG